MAFCSNGVALETVFMVKEDMGEDAALRRRTRHPHTHPLPGCLQEVLENYYEAQDGVKHLSIGHSGEWFVKFNSGLCQWSRVHHTLDYLLSEVDDSSIEWVELGEDGTFVALFEDFTAWYGTEGLTKHLLSRR